MCSNRNRYHTALFVIAFSEELQLKGTNKTNIVPHVSKNTRKG